MMPCRVGITTDPENRKKDWERQVVGLTNWRKEFVGSKEDAQQKEYLWQLACNLNQLHGECHAHPGGGDPDKYGWWVYEFDYERES